MNPIKEETLDIITKYLYPHRDLYTGGQLLNALQYAHMLGFDVVIPLIRLHGQLQRKYLQAIIPELRSENDYFMELIISCFVIIWYFPFSN